ncbi:MAG: GNAT family N-acetyltransferase [bacterium]
MKPQDRQFATPRRLTLRDGRNITVRLLNSMDAEAIVDFYAAIPDEDGVYYMPPSCRTREKALERAAMVDDPYEVCLVLVDDDGMIHGEAWYRWDDKERKNQSWFGIAIRRTMQGVGAGRIIMTRLMEIGDLYGPPVMDLTVQVENERAWKLYTSMGFKIIRQQMRDAREDAPEMPEFYAERKMGNSCRAGAATRTINPEIGSFLPGQLHNRKMTYVRDNLEINLLYIANREAGVCLVSMDHSGLFKMSQFNEMRTIISRETGLPVSNIMISSTHTHTGGNAWSLLHDAPDNDDYLKLIFDNIGYAAHEAFSNARPVKVGSATGQAHVGFNRRLCWKDSTHTMYGDSSLPDFTGLEGPDDPTHTVLFVQDEDGKYIAICHNNCSHSTSVEGDYFASADFPGEARRVIREALSVEVPVLYLQGASGDTSPWDMSKTPHRYSGEQRLHEMGAALAAETLRLLRSTTPINNPVIKAVNSTPVMEVRMPTAEELATARATKDKGEENTSRWDYVIDVDGVLHLWDEFHDNPQEAVPLSAIRIGDLVIAANPFELYCQFGLDIRRRSAAKNTMIAQLTNGCLGYVPTIYGILGGGYSGRAIYWARMEPYAGYKIVDETARLLGELTIDN